MVTVTHNPAGSLDPVHCFELLERICSSNELRRAARLREFLHYVGQRALNDNHALISEQEIGVQVFGRQENYDTAIDNIVRVNASELRKRIAAYYASEGTQEHILLDIPRGSYSPIFSLRIPETAIHTEPREPQIAPELRKADAATQPHPVPLAWKWVTRSLNAALILALAVVCLHLFNQNRAMQSRFLGWKSDPTIGPLWTGMLESPRQTDIVLADTSVALVEDLLGQSISLADYLNRDYLQQIQTSNFSPERKNDLRAMALKDNGAVGDFRVAQKILAFEPSSPRIHLQFARQYQPSAIKGDNLILIGSGRSNPWTSLFENRLNFVLDYDLNRHEMLVMNRHPQSGESAIYELPASQRVSSGLSVIDFIPNDDHTADVLIIAGTSSEATEAAGDFLTSGDSFHRFQNQLQLKSLPYFELLLKTTKLAGTPLAAEVIAYRILPGRPLGQQ